MATLSPHLLSLCLLLLLLPLSVFAQTYRNITIGDSLSTSDENPHWSSPSGEFAFGFHPIQGGGGDLFLLAIWFAKVPVENIVWTANEGNPVEKGSKIELTSDGVLVLSTPNVTDIWNAQTTDGQGAATAAMLDTGNFVLMNSESAITWASFDNPTDTILPTQTLKRGSKLLSRKTEEDYSLGRFELVLQDDGNLVLYPLARPKANNYRAYWASNTVGGGLEMIFNQSGYIFLNLTNGSFHLDSGIPVSTRDFYQRATLDFDGVIRKYTYQKTPLSDGGLPEPWTVSWSVPQDICTQGFGDIGSGVCGFNSYCTLDQNQRPQCYCPPGYIPMDPSNSFKGCKQDFTPQSCKANGSNVADGFEMRLIPNTNWPFSDYEMFKDVDEDWCRKTCLNDCFCAAAILGGGRDCWLKKFPLSSGVMDPTTGGKALIKVGKSSSDLRENKNGRNNWMIVPGSILLGSSVFLNLLLLLVMSLAIYCGSYPKKKLKTQPNPSTIGVNLRSFTYKELEDATNGFTEELGRGAFSTVYKGVLESDRSLVAVKKLDKVAHEVDKEFKTELSAISQTNHKNLVKLLGFCDEGTDRILVYEFIKNGSLASFLFGSSIPDWHRRIQIAFGIARGLTYLHEECSIQIIHCDVKPQNVLLDDSFVVRISDFGLAKLLKSGQTRTSTGIRGTRGYVAPEWFKNMAITAKVDVYSFGIMLLEIICCRRNVELELGNEDSILLCNWAYDCCVERKLHLLVENDEEALNDSRRLERMVMVAIWCIQEDPSLRPSMRKVTQMLEGAVVVSMPPDPSSFISSIG